MRIPRQFRAGFIGLIAMMGASVSSMAHADSGYIRFSVLKAGWFIGGLGGRGVLIFHGRQYPLTIGVLSAGLVFGASGTDFVGTVHNIFRPFDVAGVYGAANAGAALVVGGGVIALTNEKGAILRLSGRQVGCMRPHAQKRSFPRAEDRSPRAGWLRATHRPTRPSGSMKHRPK